MQSCPKLLFGQLLAEYNRLVTVLRTGIDLLEINRLDELDAAIRARFLQRVFTPGELADAADSNASLAGRFAVKEAVAKALGCGIGAVGWQSIEVQRGPQGEPLLLLHGKAQDMAASLGLQQWSISISHSRTHAVAVAVGLGEL
jgi:holo-[acyl-carrier protein] synthase